MSSVLDVTTALSKVTALDNPGLGKVTGGGWRSLAAVDGDQRLQWLVITTCSGL